MALLPVFGSEKGLRGTRRSGPHTAVAVMSEPAGSQDLVPFDQDSTQLMPMDVNGADQGEIETGVTPRVEEPGEGSRVTMPETS